MDQLTECKTCKQPTKEGDLVSATFGLLPVPACRFCFHILETEVIGSLEEVAEKSIARRKHVQP